MPIRLGSTSKYRAQPTVIDNLRFDSLKESRRYLSLKLLLQLRQISNLEIQPSFPLEQVNLATGEITSCGHYVADFRYYDKRAGAVVVEDVKGMRTPVYRLKKKWVEAQHGIRITEL